MTIAAIVLTYIVWAGLAAYWLGGVLHRNASRYPRVHS